ncbi:MAG TPA: DUF6049 family protein, partial [Actinomycetota bacterium]|nr:DUF6049 family protein [Actinomycetota bacterium]
FPQEVEKPLNIVMLVPLNELPGRAPDGSFEQLDEEWPLESATQESGWLRGMVTALAQVTAPPPPRENARPNRRSRRERIRRRRAPLKPARPTLKLALAPVPRLVEELADMADGFRRADAGDQVTVEASAPGALAAAQTLADLRTLVNRDGIQPILVPYAFPDLPALTLEEVAAQLDAAETTLSRLLGQASDLSRTWLFPPAGRIDASALADLRSLQAAEHTFSSEAAFASDVAVAPGCPEPFASFTCPVSMEAGDDTSRGFVSDSKLQDLLGDLARSETPSTVAMQRFWADTVQVWAELPGTSNRVLYFALPTTWHPSPADAKRFFTSLKRAPWLRTLTPEEALARGEPQPRPMVDFETGPTAEPQLDPTLAEAAERIASLEALIPTTNRSSVQRQMLQRLNTNLLVARSRVWLDEELVDRGLSYASGTVEETDRHFQAVQIGGAEEIALTSQRAPIQLLLLNQNAHPVAVRVYLESEGLELQQDVLDEIVPAERTRQIQIDAETRASGIFPLRVSVRTADGFEIARTSIRIRSTEFNDVALGLTIGALMFLIAFYVFRTTRRRSAAAAGTDAA